MNFNKTLSLKISNYSLLTNTLLMSGLIFGMTACSLPNHTKNNSDESKALTIVTNSTGNTYNLTPNAPTDQATTLVVQSYPKYFSYPFSTNQLGQIEIQPAAGGTLIMENGCLLLKSGDTISVPVFPHGITHWDEKTQSLFINKIKISLGGKIFSNYINRDEYDPNKQYKFEQQSNPQCLKDRTIIFLGSQFMDTTKMKL